MMKRILVLVWIAAIFSGCAGAGISRGVPAYPNPETSEMKLAFTAAYDLYSAGKFGEADDLFASYISTYPYTELTDKARFYRGEMAFSREDYKTAISFYRAAYLQIQSPAVVPMARFKAALSLHRLGDESGALKEMQPIDRSSQSAILRLRIDSLGVIASRGSGLAPGKCIGWMLSILDDYSAGAGHKSSSVPAGDIISEDEALSSVRAWVGDESVTVADVESLPLADFKGKRSGGYADYKYAETLVRRGDSQRAAEILRSYISSYPKHEYYASARLLLADFGGEVAEGASVKVGLILPLSGKFAVYGESVLKGVECAAGIFQPCSGPGGTKLIVRDEMSPGKSVSSMIDELADENVVAIIGPLMSNTAIEAASRAQQRKVPLITLSQRDGVAAIGDYVFRNYVSPSAEVSTLVDYLTTKKSGMKKFFVLYPDNKKGIEYKDLFASAVAAVGGKVVGSSSYAPNQMEFAGELRGRGMLENTAGMVGSGPYYDALFIPDSFGVVGYIVPTLSLMGVKQTQLLGISRWNDKGLLERGGEFVEGALFVDSFFKDSKDPFVMSFVKNFTEAYGVEPTLLEANGYDAMRMISTAVQRIGSSGRDGVRDSLLGMVDFHGVAGKITFDAGGEASRRLFVLTVSEGRIQEAQ